MSFGDKNFTYGPRIVKDGLVFYVDAANPKSYVSGDTTTNDLISNGTGTLENGTGFSEENNGNWSFDGTDDYITIDGLNDITVNTISMWLKVSYTGNKVIMEKGTNSKMMFQPASNNAQIFYANLKSYNGGTGYLNSIMDGTWKNWVQIEDTDFSYFYVNGVLQNSQANTSNLTNSNPLVIMARTGGVAPQSGNVGPVQVYNRALSANEVLQNYNALKGRFGL